MEIDHKGRRILAELLQDSGRPQKTISSQLSMSDSDFAKHKSQLMRDGIIKRFTIDVNYENLGFMTNGYFFFKEIDKSHESADRISEMMRKTPEVVEASRVFGADFDFIVKIICKSPKEFYRVIQNIRDDQAIDKANSHSVIVAESIKDERGAPIYQSPDFMS